MSADPVGEALRALAQSSRAMLDAYEGGALLPDALAEADAAQDSLSALLSARAAEHARLDRERQRRLSPAAPAPVEHYTDTPNGRIWHCGTCGVSGPWEDGWAWYGAADGPIEAVTCPECPNPSEVADAA